MRFFVHPVTDGHIWVSLAYQKRKKFFLSAAYQIDAPGRWFADKYNCHVDGCDYPQNSLDEALKRGAYYHTAGPVEFIYLDQPYNVCGDNFITKDLAL